MDRGRRRGGGPDDVDDDCDDDVFTRDVEWRPHLGDPIPFLGVVVVVVATLFRKKICLPQPARSHTRGMTFGKDSGFFKGHHADDDADVDAEVGSACLTVIPGRPFPGMQIKE